MHIWRHILVIVTSVIILESCNINDKEVNPFNPDDFTSIIPEGWKSEVITEKYSEKDTVRGTHSIPLFVIKYTFPGYEFSLSGFESKNMVNPSLVLNFYSIRQKEQLLALIQSNIPLSSCVAWYYGETDKYFIITSPCFLNNGHMSGVHAKQFNELDRSLRTVIKVIDYSPRIPYWRD